MSCKHDQPSTDDWPEVQAAAIERYRGLEHPESHLIDILHSVQGHFGYLGVPQLDAVAQLLGVPTATVSGVAGFYHLFRLQPTGRYRLSVCLGTACRVQGAQGVAQRLCEELGISYGETSKDGLFTLEASRCLGTCGLAPVLMVGDEVHGNVTPDDVPGILRTYIDRARRERQAEAEPVAGA